MSRESIDRPLDRFDEVKPKFPVWKLVGIYTICKTFFGIFKHLVENEFTLSLNYLAFFTIDFLIIILSAFGSYYASKKYETVTIPNIFVKCFIFTIFFILSSNLVMLLSSLILYGSILMDFYSTTVGYIIAGFYSSFLFVLIWLTLEHKTTTKQ